MVDPVNPSASVQPLPSARKTQETQKQDKSDLSLGAVDEVSLSQEALSLSQAEETARQVSASIAQKPDATLSADQQRLSTLV